MNSLRRFAARAVIIDLDGTLLATAADLAAAVNAMLLELGRSPLALSDATRFIGKGAEVLVHRALTGRLDGRVESHELSPALKAFHRHYARENGLRSQLYPGVLEGLSAMRAKGLRLACVTNKPQGFSDVLLERCALSGYFVVPMNALLQHRGHVLMSAGHSIAVQNFSENGSILLMLGLYALLVKFDLSVNIVIVLFGLFVAGVMWMVMKKHAANQREYDSMHLIGEEKHVGT